MLDSKSWQVGIKGLVFNDQQHLMLIQEKSGKWELPGGRHEHGETFAETLQREVREEMRVGCVVRDEHPYWAWSQRISSNDSWRVFLCFRLTLDSFDFVTTTECINHAFFDSAGLRALSDKLLPLQIISFLEREKNSVRDN